MPALALIHGFLGSPASWREVERHLPPIEDVRRISLPGHGLPPSPSPSRAADFDALIDELADSLGREGGADLVLAGYSMGARVALHLALRTPHRIRAALLLGGDPGLDAPRERQERRRWEEKLQATLREGGMATFVAHWEALPLFASQRELSLEDQDRQRQIRLGHDPEALAAALDIVGLGRMPSAWPALSGLASPPLRFLAGAKDAKYVDIGRRMAALAPAASFDEVPGAGHNLILETPERVAAELCALLESSAGDLPRQISLGNGEEARATERLALAVADFHEEAFEHDGRTIDGLTCSLWLTPAGGRGARHVRVHAGQSLATPHGGVEILDLGRSEGRAFVRLRFSPP